jgi:hypothetical protein
LNTFYSLTRQETLELGILALIEKEGVKGFLKKFKALIKDS